MREILSITGRARLSGSVQVSGAKNAALPLLIATLLTSEECVIQNVPDLEDIRITLRILQMLGATVERERSADGHGYCVTVNTPRLVTTQPPVALVKSLRASFWVLAPLLARGGTAAVALSGGDAIGARPVDLHLDGLAALGAEIKVENGIVFASASAGLRPGRISLAYPSVGATHQLLMAAALIDGVTVIEGAARESEVVALAQFLRSMGAEIEGAGEAVVRVHGRPELGSGSATVQGDRIEAATYLIGSAMTGGTVEVQGVEGRCIASTLEVLEAAGSRVSCKGDRINLSGPERLSAFSFETAPYPGVATDVQPLLLAAATTADGISRVTENVFENRYGHVAEYKRFGVEIRIHGRVATVSGASALQAAVVEGGDIRAAAGLVLMGLAANGETIVQNLHHLDRGYEALVEKMVALGATLSRLPQYEAKEVVVGC